MLGVLALHVWTENTLAMLDCTEDYVFCAYIYMYPLYCVSCDV